MMTLKKKELEKLKNYNEELSIYTLKDTEFITIKQ